MNQLKTVQVMYVGAKPSRADTVAGTGIVWLGEGDVQEVPAEAWPKLAKHPDIWKLAEAARSPGPAGLASVKSVAATPPAETAVLIGTNHPAVITIDGQDFQLGDLVRDAFEQSGLSLADWNGLSEADRTDFVDAEIVALEQAAAARRTGDKPKGIDLEALDKAALHELAKERGVAVHHAAGADKVRAALKAAGV